MAMDRVYKTQITVPAGTLDTAPTSLAWPLEDAQLVSLEFIAPPGPSGLCGIRVKRAGTVIVPFNDNGWLIMDNDKFAFPFNEEMTATGITIEGYNTGIYDHTFYFRAVISDLQTNAMQGLVAQPIIPNDVFNGSVSA